MKTTVKLLLLAMILPCIAKAQRAHNPYLGVLNSPVDENTIVRFFFHPSVSDRFVYPLVFRVAANGDARLNTSQLLTEGRTVYISPSEMKDLIASMIDTISLARQTMHNEVLGSWEFLPFMNDMDVVVIYSKGAARGTIAPEDICAKMSVLNTQTKTPRAQWEFERYRIYNGCRVPKHNDAMYENQ